MISVGPFGLARRETSVPFFQYISTIKLRDGDRVHFIRIWYWTLYLSWPLKFWGRWFKLAQHQLDIIKFRIKPLALWLTGHQSKFYVNVYAVDRCWGGSEEGGWWYDAGTPFDGIPRNSWGCDTHEEAQLLQGWLEKTLVDYQPTRNRYSVIGGADVLAWIEEHPPEEFPGYRPHYC